MAIEVLRKESTFYLQLVDENHQAKICSLIDKISFASSLVVDNESAYEDIKQLYQQARDLKKVVEDNRKKRTEPFREEISDINAHAAELTTPLDRLIEIINKKTDAYLTMLENRQVKEELDWFEMPADEPPFKPTKATKTTVTTKTDRTFKVVDLSKVPLRYLMIDEYAIKKDLALGVFEIPGLEIQETTTKKLRLK